MWPLITNIEIINLYPGFFRFRNILKAEWSTNSPSDLPSFLKIDLLSYKLFFLAKKKIHFKLFKIWMFSYIFFFKEIYMV